MCSSKPRARVQRDITQVQGFPDIKGRPNGGTMNPDNQNQSRRSNSGAMRVNIQG